jgi:hypothetical protein
VCAIAERAEIGAASRSQPDALQMGIRESR